MKRKTSYFQILVIAVTTTIAGVTAQAQVTLSPGLDLYQEGGTFGAGNLSTIPGSTAFTKDVLGGGGFAAHQTAHVNDGVYGNSNSWIGNTTPTFTGIAFDSAQTINSFAFGRDNTGGFADRTLGLYTLQWTSTGTPGVGTSDTGDASTGWQTIGTLDYIGAQAGTKFSTPSFRHRYDIPAVVGATGMRLIVPSGGLSGGTAVDELEFYTSATPGLVTTAASGYTLGWNGNDGANFNPNPPATVPTNLSLSGTAIGSGELQPGGTHQIIRVNDGIYGNRNSWIGAAAPGQFIGVDLGSLHNVTSIAFGRDNGNGAVDDSFAGSDDCGGQCDDRSLGTYEIEFTTDGSVWTSLGSVEYLRREDAAVGGGFTEFLRHEFDLGLDGGGGDLQVRGIRLLVSDSTIAIDELEIFGTPVPEPSGGLLLVFTLSLFVCRFRKR